MREDACSTDSDPPTDYPTAAPEDVRCIRCGYDLVGLPPAGDCPECGTAIRRSLAGDRIAYADPRWLDQLVGGLRLLHAGGRWTAISGIAFVGLYLAEHYLGRVLPNHALSSPSIWAFLIRLPLLAMAMGLAVAAVGGVFVTAAEPRDLDRERMRDARPLARWGPVAAVLLGTLAWIIDDLIATPMGRLTALAVSIAATATGGIGLAALQARLREVAIRIPSGSLAERCLERERSCRRRTRFVVLGIVILLAFELFAAYGIAPGPAGQFLRRIALLATLFVFITTVSAGEIIRVTHELRTEIRRARNQAAHAGD